MRDLTHPGVILAGGAAARMGGGDKALLELGNGERLLDRAIAGLADMADPIAINANGDPARFAAFGLPVLPDPLSDRPGPLAGILAGMDWAAQKGAASLVTVAVDTPFFPRDLADRLQAAASPAGIALAATTEADGSLRRHPTFGLWPTALREDLRAALDAGLRRIVAWTDRHGAGTAVWDGAADPFFNINTREELEQARDMARAGR